MIYRVYYRGGKAVRPQAPKRVLEPEAIEALQSMGPSSTDPKPIGSLVVPFSGLPYRILNINHQKELLGSLWVNPKT